MGIRALPFLGLLDSLAKGLAWLINLIANAIYTPLEEAGLSIDSLIMKIEDDSAVAYFSLGKGNVYGVLAARMFVATRNIFLILVGLVFMFLLLRAAISPSPAKKMEAKSAITNVGLAMFMVAWAPSILTFFFFLRKFFLTTVYSGVGLSQTGGIGALYKNAANDENVVTALMFLAFAVVGVYFAIFYISVAIMQLLMLGVFPIIALQGVSSPDLVRGWFKTFLGWMLIPMVDCILFIVPIGLSGSGNLVMLVSMFALMPVRKFIFSKLGIEGADVAGLIASGTTGAMASAIEKGAGKIRDTAGAIAEEHDKASADREEASLQDDLAANERGQGGDGVAADGTSPTAHGAPAEPGETSENSGSASEGDAASAERFAVATEGGQINDIGRGGDDAISSAESVSQGAEIDPNTDGADGNSMSAGANEGAPINGSREGLWGDDDHRGAASYAGGHKDRDEGKDRVAAIYAKHANVGSFEKYKNQLSHEQLANFYRQRGGKLNAHGRGIGQAVIGTAGLAGSIIGGGAVAMYGPGSVRHGMDVGSSMGTWAGQKGVAFGADAIEHMKPVGKQVWSEIRPPKTKPTSGPSGPTGGGQASMPPLFEGGIIGAPAGAEFGAPVDVAAPSQVPFMENPIDTQYAGATEADLDTMISGSVMDGAEPASEAAREELGSLYPTSAQQSDAEAACADVFANGMQQRDGANISNLDAIAGVFANTPNLGGYYGRESGKAKPTLVFPTMANAKGAHVGSVSRSMLAVSVRNSNGQAIDFSNPQVSDAARTQFRNLARTCQGKYVAGTSTSGSYFRGLTAQEITKHAEAIRVLNGGASGQVSGAFERLDAMRAAAASANGGSPVIYNWQRPRTVTRGGKTVTQTVGRRMNGLTGQVATTAGSSSPVYARPYQAPVAPQPVDSSVDITASLMAAEAQMDQAVSASNAVAEETTYDQPSGGDIDSLNFTQAEMAYGMQREAQRTFENRYVSDAMNREATPDQIRRAQGVEKYFEDNLLRNAQDLNIGGSGSAKEPQ